MNKENSAIAAGAIIFLTLVIGGSGYVVGLYYLLQFALAGAFWPFFGVGMILVVAVMLLKMLAELGK